MTIPAASAGALERNFQERCADLADANDVDRACRVAPESIRCQRSQAEAQVERNLCEIEMNAHHRECENGRSLAEMLRGRLEGQGPADEQPSPPVCRRAP